MNIDEDLMFIIIFPILLEQSVVWNQHSKICNFRHKILSPITLQLTHQMVSFDHQQLQHKYSYRKECTNRQKVQSEFTHLPIHSFTLTVRAPKAITAFLDLNFLETKMLAATYFNKAKTEPKVSPKGTTLLAFSARQLLISRRARP